MSKEQMTISEILRECYELGMRGHLLLSLDQFRKELDRRFTAQLEDERVVIASLNVDKEYLNAEIERLKSMQKTVKVQISRQDNLDGGFAAYLTPSLTNDGLGIVLLNIEATFHAAAENGEDPVNFIIENVMHEVGHALQEFFGRQFSEDQVEEIVEKYREKYLPELSVSVREIAEAIVDYKMDGDRSTNREDVIRWVMTLIRNGFAGEFTCKGCGHELPKTYEGDIPGRCYLCDVPTAEANQAPAPTTEMKINIRGCARCGEEHDLLEFKKLQRPVGHLTHWALCPTTGEPVLLKILGTPGATP